MAGDILCIGAVLWDVLGRTERALPPGADEPGRIVRQPGGVALNVAVACRRAGLRPALLTAIGRDAEGRALRGACEAEGVDLAHAMRVDAPTGRYMAIESGGRLVAAVADARALEAADAAVLAPLEDGRLGSAARPWTGPIAVDGNLPAGALARIADAAAFRSADLRVVPASPGKAERVLPLLGHPGATLYLNRAEAARLCGAPLADAGAAAEALRARGARRVVVTDGAAPVVLAGPEGRIAATPPRVSVCRVTGAGDTFMAAHLAAERRGRAGAEALSAALAATAAWLSEAS